MDDVAVEGDRVVERNSSKRNCARFDAERLTDQRKKVLQRLALDGKKAQIDLRRVVGFKCVVVPFDFFERERNLLRRFKRNQSRDRLRIARWKLDEARESAVAEPTVIHGDVLSRELFLARKLRQRLLENRLGL